MLVVDENMCTACESCATVCQVGAVMINPASRKAKVDADVCIECYSCMNICPSNAISEID